MIVFNPLNFLFDLFFALINLYSTLTDFLYNEISIGGQSIKIDFLNFELALPSYSFSMWGLLIGGTGGLLITLMTFKLAKRLIPFL